MEDNQERNPYLLFMLLLSLLAMGMLAIETVVRLDEGTRSILGHADTLICGLFFFDFLLSLYRAENKRHYLFTWGWLDLVSSIPAIGALRAARLGRVVRILRVLRTVRAARIVSLFILKRRAQSGILAAALVTILLVVTGSVAVYHFETAADGNIRSPDDAIWWALMTITTVGYGDRYPVTSEGRVVAVVLMFAGVGLFGTISGFVAAWFMGSSQTEQDSELARIRSELAEIKQLVRRPTGAGEA